MNINNAKKGMKVKIANDISKTEKKFKLDQNHVMLNMRGKLYIINEVQQHGIQITCNNSKWIFCSDDINIPEVKPLVFNSILFDINNIFKEDNI